MIERICIKLLVGVARLGEADLFDWWGSRGLSEAGQYVLGNALPRTWTWSALEGAVLSAARRHEEVLGRTTAVHLFSDRLPAKDRAVSWLHEQKMARSSNGLLSRMRRWDRHSACQDIARWAEVPPPAGEVLAQGRRLGSLSKGDLQVADRLETVIRTLAAAYVDQPDDCRFPYLDVT